MTVALQKVDIFKCHTSHPILPATEPQSLGRLRKGGINEHFQWTFKNKKTLIQTTWASNLSCIYHRNCHWYETENQVRTPKCARRRAKRSRPRAVDMNYAKTTKPQARGDSVLRLTENRETLMHRASEQAAFARTLEKGEFYITNKSVMDGNSSTPFCGECSKLWNSLRIKITSITIMSRSDQ